MAWDPDHYLTYGDERGRPFADLLSRIRAEAPRTVVDLGCGAGNLTALLKRRWPKAEVVGIDASPEMIAGTDAEGVRFEVGAIQTWQGSADVVVSNAALQWVPGHLELLPRLAARARDWFAFQVPGNFEAPSHVLVRDLARDARFAPYVEGVDQVHAFGPELYLEVLAREGWVVDAWETTYLHVLRGDAPVFTWVSATGARPTLEALPDGVREEFVRELKALLEQAYPATEDGVVLRFRRVFVVAHRGQAGYGGVGKQ